jgi:alanine racemase
VSERRVLARVNLSAIERNCARLRARLGEGCELCAVVKADGYGHGALASAQAALRGGATRLAVAGSREALELRRGGIEETPLLVMGALTDCELREALEAKADVVVWSEHHVRAVSEAGGGRVHVKLDTGMGRLGTRDPQQASRVVELAAGEPGVELAGVMTHFATADDRDSAFFEHQLELFAEWSATVKDVHSDVVVHAANSAATLQEPRAHFDMVRCGIAAYGMDPFWKDPFAWELEPALELISYVAEVKSCAAGESAGYGRTFVAERATNIGVLPIGYGDGWRRGLSNNAEVLLEGARHPLVGTVSMDNMTVDLGPSADGARLRGAQVVLVGSQGRERITAEDVAARLDTINYEITCGLTRRVPRVYHRDGEPVQEPSVGSWRAAEPA